MTSVSPEKRTATAAYIKSMLVELRTMGEAIQCDTLVYLLEMAVLEANDIEKGVISIGRSETSIASSNAAPSAKQLATLYISGQLQD